MKRLIPGLNNATGSTQNLGPGGYFLVSVKRAQYRSNPQKPYYLLRFTVIEPKVHAGCVIDGRLYCVPKAIWKLNWFLQDFGYDSESLGRDEIDDNGLAGLRGVLRVSYTIGSISLYSLDGFAPACQWEKLFGEVKRLISGAKVAL
jgi:hypothetical protein